MQEEKDGYIEYSDNRHDEDIPAHVGEQRVPKTTHVVRHLHGLHGEKKRIGFVVEQIGNQPNIGQYMRNNSPSVALGKEDE